MDSIKCSVVCINDSCFGFICSNSSVLLFKVFLDFIEQREDGK
jgi:hypothetical protein